MVVPEDLVVVGHVADAWGLKGGIKVAPYSTDADALLGVKEWWLETGATADAAGKFRSVDVYSAKAHGDSITAVLVGVADRTVAEKLKGARVWIPRSRFPALTDGEYYWLDLIGLEVINEAGELLGRVAGLMDNGAHQILDVHEATEPAGSKPVSRLIPFVDQFVKAVDRPAQRIVVDWGRDY